jgi:hypothetical protein
MMFVIGTLKVTVIWVSEVTVPGAGSTLATTGEAAEAAFAAIRNVAKKK